MIPSKALGNSGEDVAAKFLLKKGYQILERNLRFSNGEIDLVALDGETYVIVEVKTLNAMSGFAAEDHFDKRKQEKLLLLGKTYLTQFRSPPPVRFDLIAITHQKGRFTIDHYEDVLQESDVIGY